MSEVQAAKKISATDAGKNRNGSSNVGDRLKNVQEVSQNYDEKQIDDDDDIPDDSRKKATEIVSDAVLSPMDALLFLAHHLPTF